MFAWLSKRWSAPWSRSSRWTPLLQNQREFQRTLSKERSRVDRSGDCFGFIILRLEDLTGARSQTRRLAYLLHRRLRDTDEKGHLGLGRIGVVLPATGSNETEFVLQSLLQLLAAHRLRIDGEAFVYPDQDSRGTGIGEFSDRQTTERGGALSPVPSAIFVESYPIWKRSLDVMGSAIGLALSAPIIAVLAIAIRLTSRGPAFFSQQRTGFLGETFTIYKLRTMVAGAEQLQPTLTGRNERDGPAFKMKGDPRITRLGRLLRATGLDELPQLFNVLRGDMSLVGPRPLPVSEAAQCTPWQNRRHDVKPGLTCFWQLAKSRKVTFLEWMRLDIGYSRRPSLSLDLRLILRTFVCVFLGRVGH